MFNVQRSTPACRITVRHPYLPTLTRADASLVSQSGQGGLSKGKDAVGVLLHEKQPNFFGVMHVFDL
jgi:hypothetical protein